MALREGTSLLDQIESVSDLLNAVPPLRTLPSRIAVLVVSVRVEVGSAARAEPWRQGLRVGLGELKASAGSTSRRVVLRTIPRRSA